jgi:hypothetical protein
MRRAIAPVPVRYSGDRGATGVSGLETGLRAIADDQFRPFTPRDEAMDIAAAPCFPQIPRAMLAHVDTPHAVIDLAIAGQVQVAVFDHCS